MTVLDITHPEDRAETTERLARIDAGQIDAFQMRKRFLNAAGDWICAQIDATVLSAGDDWRLIEQIQDVSERQRHEQQLTYLADHDAQTGLLNRRALARELDRLESAAARHRPAGALVLIDLDNFKDVNDTLGHTAGDEVIAAAGCCRAASVRPTSSLASAVTSSPSCSPTATLVRPPCWPIRWSSCSPPGRPCRAGLSCR